MARMADKAQLSYNNALPIGMMYPCEKDQLLFSRMPGLNPETFQHIVIHSETDQEVATKVHSALDAVHAGQYASLQQTMRFRRNPKHVKSHVDAATLDMIDDDSC